MSRRQKSDAGLFGEPVSETPCSDFETFFWQHYPKKVGKLAAKREWDKLKPTAAVCQQIQQALAWQVTQPAWTKDRGQWVPEPRKWLHHGRWLDEPQIVPRSAHWSDGCQHQPKCQLVEWHRLKLSKGE